MADLTFLDANVFMYAAGAPHPLKEPCLRILADVETGALAAVTYVEVMQELLYRYSHIGLADKGILLCREILQYPLNILPVVRRDVEVALDLYAQYGSTGLKPRDAIHVATMQSNQITQLIRTDKDFDPLKFLTRIDPSSYTTSPQS
jgi:hypothetical protein